MTLIECSIDRMLSASPWIASNGVSKDSNWSRGCISRARKRASTSAGPTSDRCSIIRSSRTCSLPNRSSGSTELSGQLLEDEWEGVVGGVAAQEDVQMAITADAVQRVLARPVLLEELVRALLAFR
jgi:hypothetical protein